MYICFEGIDGSGKTTHSALIAEWLRENGYSVEEIREPTDSDIGLLIRRILGSPDAKTPSKQKVLALLFAADRLLLRDKIDQSGHSEIVISDRCYYSSIAYQSPQDWVKIINRFAQKPDIVILLDVEIERAMERCGGTDEFEESAFLERVRKRYLELADRNDFYVVDANRGVKIIQSELKKIIAPHLGLCSGGL